MCEYAVKRLSALTGQETASIHKCTGHFFPSTVVEPDDCQGSQPVSLWHADTVSLIHKSRRDTWGGRGHKCVCEKVCEMESTSGNNLQYISQGESAVPTTKHRLTLRKKSIIVYKSNIFINVTDLTTSYRNI